MAPRVVWSLQWNAVIHIESSSARNWCFSCKNVFFFPPWSNQVKPVFSCSYIFRFGQWRGSKNQNLQGQCQYHDSKIPIHPKGCSVAYSETHQICRKEAAGAADASLQFFVVQPLLFCWTLEPRRISRCWDAMERKSTGRRPYYLDIFR